METNEKLISYEEIYNEILDEKKTNVGSFQGVLFFILFPLVVELIFLIVTNCNYSQLQAVGVGFPTIVISFFTLLYLIEHPFGKVPTVTDDEIKERIKSMLEEKTEQLELLPTEIAKLKLI